MIHRGHVILVLILIIATMLVLMVKSEQDWQAAYDANQKTTFYEGVYAGCFGLVAGKIGPDVSETVCNKLVRDGKAKDVFHQGDKFYPGYAPEGQPTPAQQTPAPHNNGESGA